jgi:hypothetical protein
VRLSFRDLAPAADPWIGALTEVPLIQQAKESVWLFAVVEAGHLLSLAVLGGAVLALNLRLLGLVLTSEPATEVERRTRPWLHAGVAGALATGIVMGVMNAAGLYGSAAFLVKMVALVAAILFSYAVVREVVQARASPSPTAMGLAALALLTWGVAVFLLVTTPGLNPGSILVVAAGAGLLAAAAKRHRALLLVGLAALLVGGWFATSALAQETSPFAAHWLKAAFVTGALLFIVAIGALELRADRALGGAPAKLAAFASALAWVTVAAAGRWIGFS